ncbi:transcription-repair coupling factor [Pseudoclavibacter chungangensis]|uniref:Transcription-repair-coupling factor n=2 Tax=Pseudoclavibacter chungangensis TaxID=587635 RepID=A0A7J5BUP6_9MICO|nr:transcription-repair coupling factor [Pseudoclavibacter chungangensis]KAB1658055.1 transcription-repair coupling factor [Pseudoclavibacter chungangensis]
MRAPLIASLVEERARTAPPMLFAITATSREAEQFGADLGAFLPDATIIEFPAWETLPHERLSPSAETVGRRLAAMRALAEWRREDGPKRPFVLLASVRAALQPLMPRLDEPATIDLAVGQRGVDLQAVASRLVELAYTRVDMVTRRGEFAVRGGLLDVFPPDADHALRIDFFGDEVDEIRAFSVTDQRSLEGEVGAARLTPSRELLLDEGVRQRAAEMLHEFPNLQQILAKVAEGIPVEGMESLAPALVDELVPITTYLPDDAAVAVLSPERVATRAANLAETNREFLEAAWSAAVAGAEAPIDLASGDYLTVNALHDARGDRPWWTFSPFQTLDVPVEELGMDELLAVKVAGEAVPSFAGNAEGAVQHTADRVHDGWRVVVTSQGAGLVDRAASVLAEREIAARRVDELPEELEPGIVYLVRSELQHGVEIPGSKLALLTETDFYGRQVGYDSRQPKKLARRRAGSVVDPLQLQAGDIVVHETHGIGRFVELVSREVKTSSRTRATTTREYLVIEYTPSKRGHPGDKLFVPTDQLDQLTRYVGGENPALSKMGGSDWAAAKGKARKAVRDIAVELVKLYSARMASKGYAFGADTPWQHELEEAFPYIETPDQLQTIDEVKRDMERPIPMDRLLSGDVGFGKTEVAIRAAFKAVQDGKQVVVLVPTTLLVRQHLETFSERMAGFPITIRPLSRFQTKKESAETIQGLADGSVDIVIGTHRLLTDTIGYKDVGLVIIDEEQRFGVEHKDALKKLKTNVDILAMSATPIPRTLEMAVTGIREMSTLATPPEDRHPILTFVGPRSDRQVAAAIRRELLREGQVFYVHNRVASINRVAAELAELVPEARIGVAHGKLSESRLEQVIVDFWERKFDVLVTTTIVETGLDIPNANTLIIDDAERYGLSQLHQLRGRVGRGRERAYAYFLYDGSRPLTETATDRLETIAANNELGSGMQVALKDLELRGAGNMLGGEQSGHIAGVGFDLYLRMIGEAVGQFRGDVAERQTELRLELPLDARVPEEYVASERLRLEAYQKLSSAAAPNAKPDAIDLVLDELRDRYGEPPEPVRTLIDVSRLRRLAMRAGLSELVLFGKTLRVSPAELPDSKQIRLQRMYPGARYVEATKSLAFPTLEERDGRAPSDEETIAWVRGILRAIFDIEDESEPEQAAGPGAGAATE